MKVTSQRCSSDLRHARILPREGLAEIGLPAVEADAAAERRRDRAAAESQPPRWLVCRVLVC